MEFAAWRYAMHPFKLCLVVDTIWTFEVLLLCSVYSCVVALMRLSHRYHGRVEGGVSIDTRIYSMGPPAVGGVSCVLASHRGRRGHLLWPPWALWNRGPVVVRANRGRDANATSAEMWWSSRAQDVFGCELGCPVN